MTCQQFHKTAHLRFYVDDNKLYTTFPIQQCSPTVTKMNNDLIRIRDWCFDNCLLLNASKTKLMLFGSRQMIAKLPDFRLSLLGMELIPVQSAKDLGVIFDPSLSFDSHVVKTVSSCMSSLAWNHYCPGIETFSCKLGMKNVPSRLPYKQFLKPGWKTSHPASHINSF